MVEKMDDDRSTTFSVSFMGQNHFMGMVDRDKVSTIVLVNKVMKLVYKRKMTWDERFKLTVTQPWDNLLVKIDPLRWDGYLFAFFSIYVSISIDVSFLLPFKLDGLFVYNLDECFSRAFAC